MIAPMAIVFALIVKPRPARQSRTMPPNSLFSTSHWSKLGSQENRSHGRNERDGDADERDPEEEDPEYEEDESEGAALDDGHWKGTLSESGTDS